MSAIVVIAGLYLVLWGKAEETSTTTTERGRADDYKVQDLTVATALEGSKADLEAPLLADGHDHDIEKDEHNVLAKLDN